jgi:hypothetical protein
VETKREPFAALSPPAGERLYVRPCSVRIFVAAA